MYHLLYVDNGGITADTEEELKYGHEMLISIFSPFKFGIQKLVTNEVNTQKIIESSEPTLSKFSLLLGLNWNRNADKLSCVNLSLDATASTKRLILKSIASNYDVFNFSGPLLNRARIFLH